MTTHRILDDLPAFYEHIFPDFFESQIPIEVLSTCQDCAMCLRPDQPKFPNQEFFLPDAKCCTFHPKLTNYLVGGLLSDATPELEEGRRRVREKISRRIGINPHSILPSKKFAILHKFGGERAFGRNANLLCPYFVKESGLCSVWKFREAVCTTYYCKPVAGQEGKKFWNVLRGYLMQAQDAIAWYALNELKWDVEILWDHLGTYSSDMMDMHDVDDQPIDDEAYQKIWGEWAGREEEFYKKTYEIANALTREDFQRIGGINQTIFFEWVKKRYNEVIAPQMPEKMKANPELRSMPLQDGKIAVKTEAGIFTIQPALFHVLNLFDGNRTTKEIVKLVWDRYNDTLSDELLIPMYQNRMVIPA